MNIGDKVKIKKGNLFWTSSKTSSDSIRDFGNLTWEVVEIKNLIRVKSNFNTIWVEPETIIESLVEVSLTQEEIDFLRVLTGYTSCPTSPASDICTEVHAKFAGKSSLTSAESSVIADAVFERTAEIRKGADFYQKVITVGDYCVILSHFSSE